MEPADKKDFYILTLKTDNSDGHSYSLKFSHKIFQRVVMFVILLVSISILSVFYSIFISGKLIHYKTVVAGESFKNRELSLFAKKTTLIKDELQQILDENNELRESLGLKVSKKKIDIETDRFENSLGLGDMKNKEKLKLKLGRISMKLDSSAEEIKKTAISINEIKKRYRYIQSRLTALPSSVPIHGAIVSRFGYRSYPWRGLHTGIDFKANYGDAVRATGDGVVTYSGWIRGYGYAVQIAHTDGFSTLYGHNSKLLVSVGDKVKKGEIICQVGMTGYTTGPHLHYEVRKFDVPINPIAFIDLNVLSAGRYFSQ